MRRAIALVMATALFSSRAMAEEKGTCDQAYESGQEARSSGRLLDARTKFLACSHPLCPTFEQVDCSQWLVAIRDAIPSVVVTSNGARVKVDGIDAGGRVELDPGPHALACERNGSISTERFTLARGESKPIACPSLVALAAPERTGARASAVPAIITASIGFASITAGLVLDAKGYFGDTLPLRDCTPSCAPGAVDAARAELVVGDVLVGVGLVVVGVAVYLFFHRPAAQRTASQPWVIAF